MNDGGITCNLKIDWLKLNHETKNVNEILWYSRRKYATEANNLIKPASTVVAENVVLMWRKRNVMEVTKKKVHEGKENLETFSKETEKGKGSLKANKIQDIEKEVLYWKKGGWTVVMKEMKENLAAKKQTR